MVDETAAGKPEVKRNKYLSGLSVMFMTLTLVFASLSLFDVVYYGSDFDRRTKIINDISFMPYNLQVAPNEFKHSLALELSDFPIDELTQSKAWQLLEEKTSAYSQRLSLCTQEMDKQQQRSMYRNILFIWFCIFSLIGGFITQSKLKKLSKTTKAGTACSS